MASSYHTQPDMRHRQSLLKGIFSADKPDQYQDQGDDQQDVDEPVKGVRRHPSQQPQNQQNNSNG
jgi:hypothetical protein